MPVNYPNQELIEKWIEALRSGQYRQGVGKLRLEEYGEDYWCCLGVLCDLVNPNGWDEEGSGYYSFRDKTSYLDISIKNEICMSETMEQNLVNMNDGKQSFETIANVIENEWKDW